MRRLTTIALALVACALVLSAVNNPAWANGGPVPLHTMELYAGQHTNIGTVTFSTDGVSLFVRYQTNGEWGMTETHLYVGTEAPARGSPGQFPYGEEDLDYVTSWEWEMALADLGIGLGDSVYVAAHAVAWELGEMTIVSDTSVEVIRFNGVFLDPPEPAALAWVHPTWDTWITNPYFSDSEAEWIWSTYYATYPVEGEVVWFRREFNLPDFDVPVRATLRMAADNGYLAFLNGDYAAHHGLVLTDDHGGWEVCHDECHVPMWCWQCPVETWEVGALLVPGTNSFVFGAVDEQMTGGTVESNPAGVIFELYIEGPTGSEETAWALGSWFWKQGWGSWDSFTITSP